MAVWAKHLQVGRPDREAIMWCHASPSLTGAHDMIEVEEAGVLIANFTTRTLKAAAFEDT
jgi:hypothetical protein